MKRYVITKRQVISIILNCLIIAFTVAGTVVMLTPRMSAEGAVLASRGWKNLRYFTVLSNEFCGIVSILWLVQNIRGKTFSALLKLMAVASVGLTFVIVAFFLAPMNPHLNLYQGGNLWFHLIVPVTAMIEFVVLDTDRLPVKQTLIAALPSLIYGLGYLVNILINGKGEWPDTNDWYGFLTWGYPTGFLIFGFIFLMNWVIACLMQLLNKWGQRFFCLLRIARKE